MHFYFQDMQDMYDYSDNFGITYNFVSDYDMYSEHDPITTPTKVVTTIPPDIPQKPQKRPRSRSMDLEYSSSTKRRISF